MKIMMSTFRHPISCLFQNFKPQRTYIGRDETGAALYVMVTIMDEGSKGIRHGGGGAYLHCRSLPQYISAFATRVLLSTYKCVKGEKA